MLSLTGVFCSPGVLAPCCFFCLRLSSQGHSPFLQEAGDMSPS
jgi:hypothetical protein